MSINMASWFAGILEGEACFDKHVCSRIRINNTDMDIIDKCKKFLTDNSILFFIEEDNRQEKIQKIVNIRSQDVKNLYTLINSKVECRLNQFQKILDLPETNCGLNIDLSWLLGIFEAEGTLYINYNANSTFTPTISVANTNKRILDKIKINLNALNCEYSVTISIDKLDRFSARIYMRSIVRIKKFLTATKNLWQSRRNIQRVNLMLEFVNLRISKKYGSPYTMEEVQIYHAMKGLNE